MVKQKIQLNIFIFNNEKWKSYIIDLLSIWLIEKMVHSLEHLRILLQ